MKSKRGKLKPNKCSICGYLVYSRDYEGKFEKSHETIMGCLEAAYQTGYDDGHENGYESGKEHGKSYFNDY